MPSGRALLRSKLPDTMTGSDLGFDNRVVGHGEAEETWQMVGETGAADEVFIVDDDPAICTMLSIVFSRKGYRATCFADGPPCSRPPAHARRLALCSMCTFPAAPGSTF